MLPIVHHLFVPFHDYGSKTRLINYYLTRFRAGLFILYNVCLQDLFQIIITKLTLGFGVRLNQNNRPIKNKQKKRNRASSLTAIFTVERTLPYMDETKFKYDKRVKGVVVERSVVYGSEAHWLGRRAGEGVSTHKW